MITAIVHIDAGAAAIPEVGAALVEIPEVREVYSVTGDIDLIAIVKVERHEDLAPVIADRVSKLPGVLRTQTYIAFREYSRRDLDEAFDLGAEG